MRSETQVYYATGPGEIAWRYEPGTGRQLYSYSPTDTLNTDQFSSYDRAGNRTFFGINTAAQTPYPVDEGCAELGPIKFCASLGTEGSNRQLFDVNVQFYDAAGRLRLVDRRACLIKNGGCDLSKQPPPSSRSAFEEYRYDALGRRVVVRTRQDYACTTNCLNAIKRVVWDGDQLLYEVSAPGWTGAGALMQRDTGLVVPATYINATPDPRRITFPNQAYRGFYYGRVMYTHGGGIDAPLSLTRMEYSDTLYAARTIFPHADWRGSYDYGTGIPCRQIAVKKRLLSQHTEPGLPDTVPTTYEQHCYSIDWPAPHMLITRVRKDKDYLGELSWMGSLLNEQRDASGQMYRRNRYYDPASGRFTQEDPIGIAGGLNVYGYANGDPVSYSDPYGLCPPADECVAKLQDWLRNTDEGQLTTALVCSLGCRGTTAEAQETIDRAHTAYPMMVLGVRSAGAAAARGGGEVLSRLGTSRESASRLARKAAEAEERIGVHGVSVTAGRPNGPASSASRASVEAHFPVHNTGTPPHRTVELPKPVTKEVANLFNRVFGRQ